MKLNRKIVMSIIWGITKALISNWINNNSNYYFSNNNNYINNYKNNNNFSLKIIVWFKCKIIILILIIHKEIHPIIQIINLLI